MSTHAAAPWADFTRDNYRRLLLMAKAAYELQPLADFAPRARLALWRHDVDASPQGALALASIEHEEGVRATYYFNLRSEFYNLFEPEVADIVHQVAAFGHEIGLHYDAANADISSVTSLEQGLAAERDVFRAALGVDVRSFSFHNPSVATAQLTARTYGGLLNAYGKDLLAAVDYCSDSNGYWRFTPLEQFLGGGRESIYVLTHPEWWQAEPMSPRERIVRCVEGRAAATLRRYDTLLEVNNRRNIR